MDHEPRFSWPLKTSQPHKPAIHLCSSRSQIPKYIISNVRFRIPSSPAQSDEKPTPEAPPVCKYPIFLIFPWSLYRVRTLSLMVGVFVWTVDVWMIINNNNLLSRAKTKVGGLGRRGVQHLDVCVNRWFKVFAQWLYCRAWLLVVDWMSFVC